MWVDLWLSILFHCMHVFVPSLCCFNYWSSWYCLKCGRVLAAALYHFLRIALAILSFMYLYKFLDYLLCCCSVAKCVPLSVTPWLQHPKLPCPTLSQFTQTHVHWVSDAIQWFQHMATPSPLVPQSFPASVFFPKSQFFTSVPKVLELKL